MVNKFITINNKKIGNLYAPYIIAEVSGNHNGDINRAKKLIKVAHAAGADAVKLQTFTADSLTINTQNDDFILKTGIWAGQNLYELYQSTHTPWEWFPILFEYAHKIGITIFSSPFDIKAVNFLEQLNPPAYKIASNELADWPLIEAVVKTKKPIILSTGTASKEYIHKTIDFINSLNQNAQIIILHCVSAYPALAQDSHLKTMLDIKNSFDVLYGLSDHTLGISTSLTAVALGANVIEKHITLKRNDGGPDSTFSLEPEELRNLCCDAKAAWQSIGEVKYGSDTNLEKKAIFTRQLWSIKEIKIGETLSWENIKSIRAPSKSDGVSTMEYKSIINSKAKKIIPKHSPITFQDINL